MNKIMEPLAFQFAYEIFLVHFISMFRIEEALPNGQKWSTGTGMKDLSIRPNLFHNKLLSAAPTNELMASIKAVLQSTKLWLVMFKIGT